MRTGCAPKAKSAAVEGRFTEVEEAVAAEEVQLLLRGGAVEVDVVGICRGAARR